MLSDDFIEQVLMVVDSIPEGKVATYGLIAKLIGRDKNSRLVGKALSFADRYGEYPCHRVVNSNGRLVEGWYKQRELLLNENITFKKCGNVNLKENLWDGEF
jgi:Predicted methylated DNA-protein cysteine methyltransferase